MHQDDSKYKCTVNDEKSVVNFDLTIKNNKINKIDDYGTYLAILFVICLLFIL
jgi:hypothetical protein